MAKTTHIVAVSVPAFTHQASMIEFCKILVQRHQDLHVTCIFPTVNSPPPATVALLETLPPTMDCIFLPPIQSDDLPQGILPGVQLQLGVSRSIPSLRDALKSLSSSSRLVALVADPTAHEAIVVAKEFNLLFYVYFPYSVMIVALFFHLPKLDEAASSDHRDLSEVIKIPGCVPFHGRDIPDHLHVLSSQENQLFLQSSKRCRLADGILVNSSVEMEEATVRVLNEEGSGFPMVYPVGPVIQTGSSSYANGSDCLRWLHDQSPKSVLYISFGSGGSLSQAQLNELALGLELSGQKFLWVLRPPKESAYADYLKDEKEEPLQFLPSGFLERTNGQGLVVPYWAPQIGVLSHSATGGFLSHCGWNSTLESVVHGVPLIAWPLFAEQKMNAAMLTNGLKVAIRPKAKENGIVERQEVAMAVRSLMEGEQGREIRKRMKELKIAAADAIKEQGSSTKTLSQLANKLRGL